MRAIFLLSLFCLAGCTTSDRDLTASTTRPPTILVVTNPGRHETCYARFVGTYPLDRICVKGDTLRYVENFAADSEQAVSIPVTVSALFENIPVETILRQRRHTAVSVPVS